MDKVKLSSIRQQFPMYGDLPDEQLLIRLRKKFYADIPMKDFVNRIDFDTQREQFSPTSGMSGFEKFVAGYGKAGAVFQELPEGDQGGLRCRGVGQG